MAQRTAPGAHSCVIHPGIKGEEPTFGGKYGRMFPALPACTADEETTADLGRSRSRMDEALLVEDEGSENPRVSAGFAILGQFIAHDITADRSALALHASTGRMVNSRRPRLDLECLYGDGPVGNPFLYDRADPDKLLASEGDHDLPRNHQGTALLGDPRNDVHLPISQLHLAYLKFHNGVVDLVREGGVSPDEAFKEARRLVSWHHQWIVVNEYLPLCAGGEVVADVLENGRRYYEPGEEPFIPVEFSAAAYRFGHAQILPSYRLNDASGEVTIFPDCLGFKSVSPERAIDWSWFFEVSGSPHPPQPSRRILPSLTHALIDLPEQIVGHTEVPEHHSLAYRDLERGAALALPSGEAVAREMGVEPLTAKESGLSEGFSGETPLWYYVLREAEVRAGGERLGPVGGRIVAEVLIGLLDADGNSYRSASPGWQPTLPSREPETFRMADLLAVAGLA